MLVFLLVVLYIEREVMIEKGIVFDVVMEYVYKYMLVFLIVVSLSTIINIMMFLWLSFQMNDLILFSFFFSLTNVLS